MSVFIRVEVDANEISPEVGQELVSVCPVNIFAMNGDGIHVVSENEDECTLCELCLRVAPRGTVRLRKLYKDEVLVSFGSEVAAAESY